MAPKGTAGSSPRKTVTRQTKLSFKTTKPGAASTKTKGKTTSQAQIKPKSESEESSLSESDDFEDDLSDDGHRHHVKFETLDPEDKTGQFKRYYKEVKKQLGTVSPIHAEEESKVYKMLRVFDNTYDFGPCVGLTRMERWERAEAMGLNPPPEVRDILLTEQGRTDPQIIHPVFYGQVV